MLSINITLESGVSLALVVLEQIDSMLIDIRKKIREEVNELVPQEFHFISVWGPPISEVQEAKMSVRDALHDGKSWLFAVTTKSRIRREGPKNSWKAMR